MTGRTHLAGGLLAGLAVSGAVAPEHVPVLLAAAALAGPAADVDHPGSAYGRFLPVPGVVLRKRRIEAWSSGLGFHDDHGGRIGRQFPGGWILWHRGPAHSVTAAFALAALCGGAASFTVPASAFAVFIGVLAGSLSHLALDLLNIAPISLWWPFRRKTAQVKGVRIRVGSPGEWGVDAALLLVLGLLFQKLVLVLLQRGR